ncbi:MAG: ABC transporter permease [Bacteroidales bacterium]|nr:ABC transporter permease [Bacteroidales bacterium]
MKFEYFIAKKLISRQPGKHSKTKPLVGTAILAIALGMTVMIISIAVLIGFKKEITTKLVGFSSHIQLVNLDNNSSFETAAIDVDITMESWLDSIPTVNNFHRFATKPGIIKFNTDLQGIVLKGVDQNYNWNFLSDFMVEGSILDFPSDKPEMGVIISQKLASLLKIRLGDKMPTYFFQNPPRGRPFEVKGIYKTGLDEFDKVFVFCDIRHIQSVNGWTDKQITGYEIFLHNEKEIDKTAELIQTKANQRMLSTGVGLDVQTVHEISSGFFDFLKLTDTNVWIILTLMILVSGFNMISALLILIINRTNMIGVLKSLGASSRSLRRIFLIQAAYIISLGLLAGNLLGILICIIQENFKLMSLDPESYFVDAVPIYLNPLHIIILNIGALIITLSMLILPSGIISRISPAKTIKFD